MLLNVRLLHVIVVCAGLSARKLEVFSTYTDKHWYRHHQIHSSPLNPVSYVLLIPGCLAGIQCSCCNGFLGAKTLASSMLQKPSKECRYHSIWIKVLDTAAKISQESTSLQKSEALDQWMMVGIGAVWKYCHKWCSFHARGTQYILVVTATGRATPEIYTYRTYDQNMIGTFCLVPLNGLLSKSLSIPIQGQG